MTERSYTVIWVPHSEGNFRKFHISKHFLVILASTAGALVLGILAVSIHYALFVRDLGEVRELRRVNAELRRQNLDYEVSTEHLSNRVASLQDFVTKLSVMAGLGTELPGESGGGVGSLEDNLVDGDNAYTLVRENLQHMASQMSFLEEKSRVLERFYEDHTLMLASTPSIWPVRGYLSSGFGMRRDPFTGQREMHQGIDISTPIGKPVVAPADGTVIFANRRGGYGNVIVIDHSFGTMTRYGHLSRINVAAGRRVKRGEVIAYVGNTGKANGPHLHYEVWVEDRVVHPLNYILEYSKSFAPPAQGKLGEAPSQTSS